MTFRMTFPRTSANRKLSAMHAALARGATGCTRTAGAGMRRSGRAGRTGAAGAGARSGQCTGRTQCRGRRDAQERPISEIPCGFPPRLEGERDGGFLGNLGESLPLLAGQFAVDRHDALDLAAFALFGRSCGSAARPASARNAHCLRSAYMRSVIAVQAPRLASGRSNGAGAGAMPAKRRRSSAVDRMASSGDLNGIGVAPIQAIACARARSRENGARQCSRAVRKLPAGASRAVRSGSFQSGRQRGSSVDDGAFRGGLVQLRELRVISTRVARLPSLRAAHGPRLPGGRLSSSRALT